MIHYHGMPLGGPLADAGRFLLKRHAMVSFAYPESLPIVAEACQSFVLDNGAFTAWKSGKTFDMRGYAEWVQEWSRHPACDWVLIPDVIDGTEKDNANLVQQWATGPGAGIPSVPVWHLHESLDYLQYLAGRFQRVALGSSGKWATPGTESWWARMAEAMSAICDDRGRPFPRLHGLRMLNPEIFGRLPLASADSTNAAQNNGLTRRFGMYAAPHAWQRAAVIADRIEAAPSAVAWEPREETAEMLFESAK